MRVAWLNPTAILGGAERALLDMLAGFAAAEPEAMRALVIPAEGPLADRARALGVDVRVVPMPPPLETLGDSGLRGRGALARSVGLLGLGTRALLATPGLVTYVRALRATLRELSPDVVHSNGLKLHALAPLLGHPRVVWHLHDFLGERAVMSRALRWAARGAVRAFAVSAAAARDAAPTLGSLPIDVVPNAVDTQAFSPGPGAPDRLDSLGGLGPLDGESALRIGLVATYAPWKGHGVFLDAVARTRREVPNVTAFVVGGPVYRTSSPQVSAADLRQRAHALSLPLGLVPFQEDVAWVYRSLDVVVQASTKPEPFGLTIAEALACGRPVVAARGSGVAEILPRGTLIETDPNDPAALAAALTALGRDPDRREALARAGRAAALAVLSRERLGCTLRDHYRAVLASPVKRSPKDL